MLHWSLLRDAPPTDAAWARSDLMYSLVLERERDSFVCWREEERERGGWGEAMVSGGEFRGG